MGSNKLKVGCEEKYVTNKVIFDCETEKKQHIFYHHQKTNRLLNLVN